MGNIGENMNKINLDIKSPWALLITLIMGAALMTVLAFADHDDDNYENKRLILIWQTMVL